MAEPDKPRARRTSRRRHSRQSGIRRALARLGPWRAEILILLVVAFAIFLLVERMQIRQTLLSWLVQGTHALQNYGGAVVRGLVAFVRNTTVSDLVGYLLLLGTLTFVVWRTRWRLMRTPRFTTRRCPRCGGDLHRIHRRSRDRVLNLYVPLRRYGCRDRDCHWRGLRVGKSRHE